MGGLEFAAWGLFGGFAIEGLEFTAVLRRTGRWPWQLPDEPGPLAFAISIIIRLGIGAGLAAAAGVAGEVSGPFGAVALGVAAPLVIEQLARQVTLTEATGYGSEPDDEKETADES